MRILCAALIILSVLAPGRAAFAQAVFVDEEGRSGKQVLSLPYAFYNETFGFAGAYVYGVTGYRFKEWFSAELGYRVLDVDYDDDGFVYDLTMYGPTAGFRFWF